MTVLHTILMAGGASSRFGAIKALAEYEGQAMVLRQLALAEQLTPQRVTLVLGGHAQNIIPRLPECCHWVMNDQWESGMASSLKRGVQSLPETCDAVLILLVDQLGLNFDQMTTLKNLWSQNPNHIVCARYNRIKAVPAIFPRKLFNSLLALEGDQGARKILSSCLNIMTLSMPQAAIDIDTQDDLKNIARRNINA